VWTEVAQITVVVSSRLCVEVWSVYIEEEQVTDMHCKLTTCSIRISDDDDDDDDVDVQLMQVIQWWVDQLGSYHCAALLWLPCRRGCREARSPAHVRAARPVRRPVRYQREHCALGRCSRRMGQFFFGFHVIFLTMFLNTYLHTAASGILESWQDSPAEFLAVIHVRKCNDIMLRTASQVCRYRFCL